MNIDKEREGFEAWAKSDGFDDLTRVGYAYDHPDLREAWGAWQARAALDAPEGWTNTVERVRRILRNNNLIGA